MNYQTSPSGVSPPVPSRNSKIKKNVKKNAIPLTMTILNRLAITPTGNTSNYSREKRTSVQSY